MALLELQWGRVMDLEIALRRIDELTNIKHLNTDSVSYIVINVESMLNVLWDDEVIISLTDESSNAIFRTRLAETIIKNIITDLSGKTLYFVNSSSVNYFNRKYHANWNDTKIRGKQVHYGSSNIYALVNKTLEKFANASKNIYYIDSQYEPNWMTYVITKFEFGKGLYLTRDYLDYTLAPYMKIYDATSVYRMEAGNNRISPIKHDRLLPIYICLNGCARHHNFGGAKGYGYHRSAKTIEDMIRKHGEDEGWIDKLFGFEVELLDPFHHMRAVFDLTKIEEVEPEAYKDMSKIFVNSKLAQSK